MKLGIDAPISIGVLREELVQQVAGANREAAAPGQGEQITRRIRAFELHGPKPPADGTPPPHPR